MIRTFIENRTTTFLLSFLCLVFGLNAYLALPRESNPDIKIPVVLVSTPYTGVSPEDIEGLVSIPLERELASLQDVKKLSSTSSEGISVVSIEFEPDVIIEDALQKVRDRVNRAKPNLPEDALEPSIREIAFTDIPILLITIAGPVDEQLLKRLGEDLQDDVARISGVLDAKLSGGREKQIRVQVNPDRLAHYGLALHDITGAIRDENVNIPGGTLTIRDGNFLVRVPSEFNGAHDIGEVAIKRVGDRPVFIKDVAQVIESYEDRQTYARMNGQPAVSLSVSKRPGSNIIDVAKAVKELAAEHSKAWPEGIQYQILSDQSIQIIDMVSDLQNNIITALILVLAVLFAFMGGRSAGLVSLAVPGSMLIAFFVLESLGFTLNMVVLFALILALGMLVDNAIVVVENIYRHIEEGKSPLDASIEGTEEVAVAVFASTATTVAAFFPLVFWTGIMGKFMGFLPKTIIIVLIASLVVAVCFLPSFTALIAKKSEKKDDLRRSSDEVRSVGDLSDAHWLMRGYITLLKASIRFRYLSLGAGIITFILSVIAYGALGQGVEFFPDTDPPRAIVAIRLPGGADVESTDRVVRQVEAILASEPNVKTYVAETGVNGDGDALRGSTAVPNEAKISIEFLADRNSAKSGEPMRVESTSLTIHRIRERTQVIPGAEVSVKKEAMGPPVGKAIELQLTGDDYHSVGDAAIKLRREIAKIPGVTDLKDNYRVGRPELRFHVDRGAAKRIGVSSNTIGGTIRTALSGSKASSIREGDDEIDIIVEVNPSARADIQQLLSLRVPGRTDMSPETFPVPLSTVARFALEGGTGAIAHVDQELMITISGDIAEGFNENEVRSRVEAFFKTVELPEGIHVQSGGSKQDQAESEAFLGRAFMLAVSLILIVLVVQFDSIAIPAIILGTVMLSLIGVLWGLILTQTPFGIIMTGIGVISLAGVVVNNAIVLLDYVQQLEARGYPVQDALLKAGLTRFRPVMLTAVTTVLGLLPMAVGVSFDFARFKVLVGGAMASFWGPMAVAVISGLSFATLLTLVMVPTLYSIYDDFRQLLARRWPKKVAVPKVTPLVLLLIGGLFSDSAQAIDLDQAMSAGLKNNVDIQLIGEQRKQVDALVPKAWSTLSPTLSASGSYNVNQLEVSFDPTAMFSSFADLIPGGIPPSDPILIQQKHSLQGVLTVSQPLFSSTALPLLRGARANAAAMQQTERRQIQEVKAGIAQSFYALHLSQAAVALAKEAVHLAEEQIDRAQRRGDAGLSTQRLLIQAKLGLSRAVRQVDAALADQTAAERSFTRLTGLQADHLEVKPITGVPTSEEEALRLSLSRADLRAAQLQRDVSQYQHHANTLGWLPRVDGRFNTIYNENTGFSGQKVQWMASANASWTLWDGGARLADGRIGASRVRAADLILQQRAERIEDEVRVAWRRLTQSQSGTKAMDNELSLAQEDLTLAERSFEAGLISWLDLNQAQLGLSQTKLAATQTRMKSDLAAIELMLAAGQW